jgi:Transglycosylase SLT domain
MRQRRALRFAAFFAALAAVAGPARGALVIFVDGRHLHVTAFEATADERVALALPGGGRMTVPLDIVDRILDDEVDHSPVVPPAPFPAAPKPAPAPRSVRTFSPPSALPSSPYSGVILDAARAHKIDPALIAAVIRVESNYAPRALSRKGARGLMQLMPATARRLGVTRSFDPRENIQGGARYLAELAVRFGETSVDLILAAYNAGERAVEEYKGVPPYRETREYVRRVLALWGGTAVASARL